MIRKTTMLALSLTLAAACGDDESDKRSNIQTNIAVNNTAANNTSANTTANNTSANTTANNTSANNANNALGYDAEAILMLERGPNPADMPCESVSTIAFGGDSVTTTRRFGYTSSGRLALLDTIEDGTFTTRVHRRYGGGEVVEDVSVDVETTSVNQVDVFSYEAGRPSEVETAVPDATGQLLPPVGVETYTYASDEEWTVTTFDGEGNQVSEENYTWDPVELDFVEVDSAGAVTTISFVNSPGVEPLHRFRVIEAFQLPAEIAGGSIDQDGDGTPDSTIVTTYDGDRITDFTLMAGGGMISFTYTYDCVE